MYNIKIDGKNPIGGKEVRDDIKADGYILLTYTYDECESGIDCTAQLRCCGRRDSGLEDAIRAIYGSEPNGGGSVQ